MKEDLPANVTLITSGDPFDLIARCQVVVGFNTTGLLEAIATGKPVIVPRFAEASDPAMQDLISTWALPWNMPSCLRRLRR